MICGECETDVTQVAYCDCFSVLCRECFGDHHCGHEHNARFTGADREPIEPIHNPEELAAALVRLRPYQLECVDAILEALQ